MKSIVTLFGLIILSFQGWTQCSVSFTSSISGNNATLTPTVVSSGNDSNIWIASTGSPSYQVLNSNSAATVTLNGLGTHNICVQLHDASWSCADTFCSSVYVGTLPLSVGATGNHDTCYQCNGSITAIPLNGVAPYTYSWSNGATTQTISNLCVGTFELTVQDASGDTATNKFYVDNDTSYVYVSGSKTDESCINCCNGSVSLSVTSGGPYSYQWSNGAGNVTTQSNLCSGVFTVTITDINSGCMDIKAFGVLPFICKSISGNITPTGESRVYLIQESNGVLTAVDSVDVDTTAYSFGSVCPGTYYVKSALLPANPLYSSRIPTYYLNAALWANASSITMTNSNISGINISLISGSNNGGAGFIGGLISQGANRGEGDAVVGATVMVFDDSQNLVGFDRTDLSGAYQIDGLAFGDYLVHVDLLNKKSFAHEVTLSAEHPSASDRNFEVQGDVIKPTSPSGIVNHEISKIVVFPNPTNDALTLYNESNSAKSWAIFNILGKRVMSESNLTNEAVINIDVQNLPDGNYILQVETETGMIQERIMKI